MKRKLLYILICLSTLTSCEKELSYDPQDGQGKLVMNALLQTEEKCHYVYLTSSYSKKMKELENAKLSCYVNDAYVAEAQIDTSYWTDAFYFDDGEITHKYIKKPVTRYKFNATFHPGDKIVLQAEANRGTLHATAEVIAPEQPTMIQQVDTSSVSRRIYEDRYEPYLKMMVHIRENNLDNQYYRLAVQVDKKRFMHADKSYRVPETDIIREESKVLMIDSMDDPIISEGNVINNEEDDIWGTYVLNMYTVFTNVQFKGKDCTLRIYAPKNDMTSLENISNEYYTEPDEQHRREIIYFDNERVERKLKVSLQNISKDHYMYLKAMNYLRYDNYEPALTEPITIPNNVKEGLGFVGISTSSTVYLDLPDLFIDYMFY